MSDDPTLIADHLDAFAEQELKLYLTAQRQDMTPKKRSRTLKEMLVSAYVQGMIAGAKAQHDNPQDITILFNENS
jgi:hypothetical protein